MKKVRLGKTDILVSEIGFGGIPIIPLDFDDAVSVVRHCFDRGITLFDTANIYGDSEKKIGKALEPVRSKVILATKTSRRDAKGAEEHIKFSFENLRTDIIDIFQFHNIANEGVLDQIIAPEGAYKAVNEAYKEGKIRFIGFSSHDIPTAIKCCRTGLFSTMQFPFNFIEHEPADELFNIAQELDIGIIGMKPLGGGLLERADLCFKFLQQYPNVVPIPGIAAIQEIDEICDLYLSPEPLTDSDHNSIDKIRSELGKKFCRRCGYCIPCEQGINIPTVMSFESLVKRSVPSITIMMVKKAMKSVENCTECGECVKKCPYNLEIPELLKEKQEKYNNYIAKHK